MIEWHTQTEMLYIAHLDFHNGLEGACILFPISVAVFSACDVGLKGFRDNRPDKGYPGPRIRPVVLCHPAVHGNP